MPLIQPGILIIVSPATVQEVENRQPAMDTRGGPKFVSILRPFLFVYKSAHREPSPVVKSLVNEGESQDHQNLKRELYDNNIIKKGACCAYFLLFLGRIPQKASSKRRYRQRRSRYIDVVIMDHRRALKGVLSCFWTFCDRTCH